MSTRLGCISNMSIHTPCPAASAVALCNDTSNPRDNPSIAVLKRNFNSFGSSHHPCAHRLPCNAWLQLPPAEPRASDCGTCLVCPDSSCYMVLYILSPAIDRSFNVDRLPHLLGFRTSQRYIDHCRHVGFCCHAIIMPGSREREREHESW